MRTLLALLLTATIASAAYKPRLDVTQAYVTTNNLGVGGNYDSGVLDMSEYSQVSTHVTASHDGSMTFTFLSDQAGTDVVRQLTVPYTAANGYQLFSAPAFTPFVRYAFTNSSGSAQTDFFFETKFLTKGLTPQLLRTDGFIAPAMISTLNRSVIVGQDSDGEFRNVPLDTEGHLKINIHEPTTAFGDLRIAELTPQVHLTFPYNINSDIVTTNGTANGGSVVQTNSMASLSTSTATNGVAIMASRNVVNYRSGLGKLARFTALFTTGVANSTQIIGIGDASDGFFFGFNGATFGVLVRKDGTDTWTSSSAWNVDTLDGASNAGNPSGMDIDETKINVFQIQFQWLGAGQIEFGVEDPNNGQFIPVHRVQYANANTDPSIYNPSLTMYAQVLNETNGSDINMKTASMSGFTEGKDIRTGPVNAYERTEDEAGDTSFTLRNKSTYVSKTNKVRIYLKTLSVGNDANSLSKFRLYRDATLTGVASYADVNGDESVIEADLVQDYSSGGKLVFEGVVGKDTGAVFDLDKLNITLAPGETLTAVYDSAQAGNQSVALIWQEDF